MTDLSQWLNFKWQRQITRLLYYYLIQIWKYIFVYFDDFDINSYRKNLFTDDSI